VKEHQAREIIFEEQIKKLLQNSGYISVVEETVYGRSGDHGIYSYAKVNMPTAFVYPVRLLCQYKYYAKNKVELAHIRDFGGIMADVSECNYTSKNDMTNKAGVNIPDRYTDAGCYFSVTAFSRPAQEYAWAHNIFLMSFERIDILQDMFMDIEEFVSTLNENTITTLSRSEVLDGFANYCAEKKVDYNNVMGVVAILNGVYPVLILGPKDWLMNIIMEAESQRGGRVKVEKTVSVQNQYETKLDVTFKEANVEFAVPNVILEKMMERRDNTTDRNIMFNIDIPYINEFGRKGFASMELEVDGFSRNEFVYEQFSLF